MVENWHLIPMPFERQRLSFGRAVALPALVFRSEF